MAASYDERHSELVRVVSVFSKAARVFQENQDPLSL